MVALETGLTFVLGKTGLARRFTGNAGVLFLFLEFLFSF